MSTNVNLFAPIGALALLGTAFLLFAGAVVLIQSLIVRRRARARITLAAMLLTAVLYVAMTLVYSLNSHEQVLARGQEKHFCELDCHLAYSIIATKQSKTFGDSPNQRVAQGQFTVVTVKTRFDENTISSARGNSPLTPNPRALTLIDERGNHYGTVAQLGTPLSTALRPGEVYLTDVAFDLPAEAKPATLLIKEDDFITRLVIGHENSVLHHKTRFQL